jgi:hypothetical protein
MWTPVTFLDGSIISVLRPITEVLFVILNEPNTKKKKKKLLNGSQLDYMDFKFIY